MQVDERKGLEVFANADTPEDAAEARRNGARGIGLVRCKVYLLYWYTSTNTGSKVQILTHGSGSSGLSTCFTPLKSVSRPCGR
jgi:hypothetical protein